MDMNVEVFGNPLIAWITALSAAIAINIAVALAKRLLLRRLGDQSPQPPTGWYGAIVAAVKRTNQILIFLVSLYIGCRWLELPGRSEEILKYLATFGLFLQLGIWLTALLTFFMARTQAKAERSDPGMATSLTALTFVGQMLIWIVIALLMLSNFGIDVTALIAGLGIGGIAIALAVQNVLGDLFASFSILMDKPFVMGDFIVVDDYMGTVEHVGIKTTRLRSLSGEQVIFSNSDLLKSRLRNYKRMRERRIEFGFGVLYQTPPEKLKKIPTLLRTIIEPQQKVRFERAHLKNFAESSLYFEVVYWMLDPDFDLYMDTQQAINLAIIDGLQAEGVDFAFPSRSLYFENSQPAGALPVSRYRADEQYSEISAGLACSPDSAGRRCLVRSFFDHPRLV
jgi:small-conductance mechanosensitive channel